MWRSARQAASKRTRTIPRARERVLMAAMAFGEEGRREELRRGLITPDRSSSARGEKGRRIETSSGFDRPRTVSPSAALISRLEICISAEDSISFFLFPSARAPHSPQPLPRHGCAARCGWGEVRRRALSRVRFRRVFCRGGCRPDRDRGGRSLEGGGAARREGAPPRWRWAERGGENRPPRSRGLVPRRERERPSRGGGVPCAPWDPRGQVGRDHRAGEVATGGVGGGSERWWPHRERGVPCAPLERRGQRGRGPHDEKFADGQ